MHIILREMVTTLGVQTKALRAIETLELAMCFRI